MTCNEPVVAPLAAAPLTACDGGTAWHVSWAPPGARHTPPEEVAARSANCGNLRVLHEDTSLIVVDKPAFLTTENTRELKDSVRSRLEATHPGESLAIVHRLDWETSGVLVVARSKASARSLNSQFAARTVAKAYVADCAGSLPSACGEVQLPLAPDEARPPMQRIDFGPAGKAAETRWTVQRCVEGAARVALVPLTGRRHQLRMHMLSLGCPIAGDALYAARGGGSGDPDRLHLHASRISFVHPDSGERVEFASATPFALEDAGPARGRAAGVEPATAADGRDMRT